MVKWIAWIGVAAAIIGCGGGGSSSSNAVGNYSGTIGQGTSSSIIIDFAVAPDGSISGNCTMLSSTSGAIIARAPVTGALNTGAGTFTLNGYFTVYVPPPPGTTIGGQVSIFGGTPNQEENTPIDYTNLGVTYHGVITPVN